MVVERKFNPKVSQPVRRHTRAVLLLMYPKAGWSWAEEKQWGLSAGLRCFICVPISAFRKRVNPWSGQKGLLRSAGHKHGVLQAYDSSRLLKVCWGYFFLNQTITRNSIKMHLMPCASFSITSDFSSSKAEKKLKSFSVLLCGSKYLYQLLYVPPIPHNLDKPLTCHFLSLFC